MVGKMCQYEQASRQFAAIKGDRTAVSGVVLRASADCLRRRAVQSSKISWRSIAMPATPSSPPGSRRLVKMLEEATPQQHERALQNQAKRGAPCRDRLTGTG